MRGFGRDVAVGLKEVCDIDVEVVQTDWSQCWSNNKIGPGMLDGHFHGCMTYTHAKGVRNRYLEFSKPILQLNKHAGVITRLNPDGTPVVKPSSNLKGVKVVDVVGWAPTQDGLAFVENRCDGRNRFSGYELIAPTFNTGNANDDALRTLLDGSADAVWIYADQAFNYKCPADGSKTAWNCTMWERLGTDFAYVSLEQSESEHSPYENSKLTKTSFARARRCAPPRAHWEDPHRYAPLCLRRNHAEHVTQVGWKRKAQRARRRERKLR